MSVKWLVDLEPEAVRLIALLRRHTRLDDIKLNERDAVLAAFKRWKAEQKAEIVDVGE